MVHNKTNGTWGMLAFITACEIGECTSSVGVTGVDARLAFQGGPLSLPVSNTGGRFGVLGDSAGGVLKD